MHIWRCEHDGRRPTRAQRHRHWHRRETLIAHESDNLRLPQTERHNAFGERRQPRQLELIRGTPVPARQRTGKYQPRITPYAPRTTISRQRHGERRWCIVLWTADNEATRAQERQETAKTLAETAWYDPSEWQPQWRLASEHGVQTLELRATNRKSRQPTKQQLQRLLGQLNNTVGVRRIEQGGTNK